MAQIPENIVNDVVAFSLDPKSDPQILNGDYQETKIIFYRKDPNWTEPENDYPSVKDLIRPVDKDKAERLKDKVKPIINYSGEGYHTVNPGNINEPFMQIGIWMRINGSNLHKINDTEKVLKTCKEGAEVSTYRAFVEEDGADLFKPNYAETISQIPDELITDKTIGIWYRETDYFKTKEGIVHKTDYILIEEV